MNDSEKHTPITEQERSEFKVIDSGSASAEPQIGYKVDVASLSMGASENLTDSINIGNNEALHAETVIDDFDKSSEQKAADYFEDFDPMDLTKQDIQLMRTCKEILNGLGTICAGGGLDADVDPQYIEDLSDGHGLDSTGLEMNAGAGVGIEIKF